MSAATTESFTWDNDYDNHEQVRPYMADFLKVRAEIEARGQYPYNDSFKGKIPGLAGPSEDTGIYLLQRLRDLDELNAKVDAFIASGGERVTTLDVTRRGTVVHYGYYMGGSGWSEWRSARLLPRDGRPYAVLPKGKRTHGHVLTHGILFREEP